MSSATKTSGQASARVVLVRHTPLTARESPGARSEVTDPHSRVSLVTPGLICGSMARTVPVPAMFQVNLSVLICALGSRRWEAKDEE